MDDEIIRHYTHVHNDASQAAMQRLARVNQELQQENGHEAPANRSAQTQHTRREVRDASDESEAGPRVAARPSNFSGEDRTPIELFIAGVREWEAGLRSRINDEKHWPE